MNRQGNQNLSTACSPYFHCYPTVASRKDLLDDGPDGLSGTTIPRWNRSLRVMGAIAEGASAVLCVERAGDAAEVAIPVPYLAVGVELPYACRALIPTATTAVRKNNDALLNVAGGGLLTLSGTPAAAYNLQIEIQSTGGLNAGTFRWSDDGGATWEEEGVTIPADGTHTLGASGLTATFADETFTDNDIYYAETFLTTVTNVMVEW